jgi:hypothetical protein
VNKVSIASVRGWFASAILKHIGQLTGFDGFPDVKGRLAAWKLNAHFLYTYIRRSLFTSTQIAIHYEAGPVSAASDLCVDESVSLFRFRHELDWAWGCIDLWTSLLSLCLALVCMECGLMCGIDGGPNPAPS